MVSKDFEKQWAYAEQHEQELNRLLCDNLFLPSIRKANKHEDMKECTDFVFNQKNLRIAQRVRRIDNVKQRRDLTIRWETRTGALTERDKLKKSEASIYVYAWEKDGVIVEYVFIDIQKFVNHPIFENPEGIKTVWADGNKFAFWSIYTLQDAGCLLGGMSNIDSAIPCRWCSSQEFFRTREEKKKGIA
jgi:hypothetical protein